MTEYTARLCRRVSTQFI